MKFKVLGLFVVFFFSVSAIADTGIERRIKPSQSAIQSTNMTFSKPSAVNPNYEAYNSAISELKNKIEKAPNNYILYASLIDLYMKTGQQDKAYEELVFINNLAKKNKLNTEVLKSFSDVLKSYSTGRFYKNSDVPVNLAMMNLILQNNAQAENYLMMSQNSKLFPFAYKEIFDTTANYTEAINFADKILAVNPSNVKLRKLKAFYLNQLNRNDEAIKEYSKVVAVLSDDKESKYELYKLLVGANKQEKDIMKALYPNDTTGYEKPYAELSNMLLEQNDVQGAKYYAEKLTKKFPENPNGYILLSDIYRREGNLQESYEALKMVRDKADDNEAISKYNVMLAKLSDQPVKEADSLMNNGLYAQALSVLESANPENLYVILGMARANYFLNNKQTSLELLNKAMSLYPNNADVFYYFAFIFYKENDIESARNYTNKALNINPNHAFSTQLLDVLNKADSDKYVNQIISSFEAQNYDETMRLINIALSINEKDSNLYYYKGLTYIAMNNYAAATAPLYKSIEIDKNNTIAYFYLALAFDNLDEKENALVYYKKFIELLPQDEYGESEKLDYAKTRIKKLAN